MRDNRSRLSILEKLWKTEECRVGKNIELETWR